MRTGRGPYSVAIGDLNGDGKPDLATANLATVTLNTVSVLLNRGDGSFQAKRDYRTGGGPYSVAIGDLNGDGKPDLATANFFANTVSVLAEQGRRQLPGQARLRNRTRPLLGRDRRPERRRQAGPGDRELRGCAHRLRAAQQGRRQLPGQARLRNRRRPLLGRDRRPERRRQAGPGDRERRPRTASPCSSTRRASARCRTSRERHCRPRSGRSRAPIAASGRSAAPTRR